MSTPFHSDTISSSMLTETAGSQYWSSICVCEWCLIRFMGSSGEGMGYMETWVAGAERRGSGVNSSLRQLRRLC